MIQERFWRELDQLKVHVFYLENYFDKTVAIDRNINMFLAITSSGSIAGWAIFNDYSFHCGLIIALTQVVNATKSFFPYAKRLKSLQGIADEMELLFMEMENDWYNISIGKYTEEQIHKLQMKFINRKNQIIQKHFGCTVLPKNNSMLQKAEQCARQYFSIFYFHESPNE